MVCWKVLYTFGFLTRDPHGLGVRVLELPNLDMAVPGAQLLSAVRCVGHLAGHKTCS